MVSTHTNNSKGKERLSELGGWSAILGTLTAGEDLPEATAEAALQNILEGEATEAQIGAFAMGLAQKGETPGELAGMVRAMREAATPLSMPEGTIDIVGMGGSPARRKAALNVSTMSCFIASAAGARICKHGNRKASSTSGSFDLLEALGVNFDLTPAQLETLVAETGVGFAFAKAYHPALRHAGPVRVQLGIRTVFNVLGPLAHPARLHRQVVGVADEGIADRMVDVLAATGSDRAWVVTGAGSLDELSTAGPTSVRQLIDGEQSRFVVKPEDLGIAPPAVDALDGGDAAANATIFHELLAGKTGPIRDIVALNAAAGLVVAGVAGTLEAGFELAQTAIDSGTAGEKLATHVQSSQEIAEG